MVYDAGVRRQRASLDARGVAEFRVILDVQRCDALLPCIGHDVEQFTHRVPPQAFVLHILACLPRNDPRDAATAHLDGHRLDLLADTEALLLEIELVVGQAGGFPALERGIVLIGGLRIRRRGGAGEGKYEQAGHKRPKRDALAPIASIPR